MARVWWPEIRSGTSYPVYWRTRPLNRQHKLRNRHILYLFVRLCRFNLASDFPNLFINQTQLGTDDSESIEWFIEDQAFLRSYESSKRPPPFLLPSPAVSLSQSSSVSPVELSDGRRGAGGGRRGAKSYYARKPGPLYIIQYSLGIFHNF